MSTALCELARNGGEAVATELEKLQGTQMDKIDNIKKYVHLLRVVAHLVDSGSAKPNVTTRALELLESCQNVEKRSKSIGNCGSCLRKLGLMARFDFSFLLNLLIVLVN